MFSKIKWHKNQFQFALIVLMSVSMIFTVYAIYSLSDALIFDYQVMDFEEYETAFPSFFLVYVSAGIMIFTGTITLIFILRNKSVDIVYVEKTALSHQTEEEKEEKMNEQSELRATDLLKTIKKSKKQNSEILNKVSEEFEAAQSILYLKSGKQFTLSESFAIYDMESRKSTFEEGEGLTGQAAKEKKSLIINDISEGKVKVASGLGESSLTHLGIFPIIDEKQAVLGVLEIASFKQIDEKMKRNLEAVAHEWSSYLPVEPTKKKPAEKKASEKKSTKDSSDKKSD